MSREGTERTVNTLKSCPYCGQGLLYKIILKKINVPSFVCDECDTVRLRLSDVRNGLGTSADYLTKWLGNPENDYLAEFEYGEVVPWPDR